jgi:hypothetical protein
VGVFFACFVADCDGLLFADSLGIKNPSVKRKSNWKRTTKNWSDRKVEKQNAIGKKEQTKNELRPESDRASRAEPRLAT